MTHFGFLQREWPGVFDAVGKAGSEPLPSPPNAASFCHKIGLVLWQIQ